MDKINDIHVLIYIHDTCLERGKEIVMIIRDLARFILQGANLLFHP